MRFRTIASASLLTLLFGCGVPEQQAPSPQALEQQQLTAEEIVREGNTLYAQKSLRQLNEFLSTLTPISREKFARIVQPIEEDLTSAIATGRINEFRDPLTLLTLRDVLNNSLTERPRNLMHMFSYAATAAANYAGLTKKEFIDRLDILNSRGELVISPTAGRAHYGTLYSPDGEVRNKLLLRYSPATAGSDMIGTLHEIHHGIDQTFKPRHQALLDPLFRIEGVLRFIGLRQKTEQFDDFDRALEEATPLHAFLDPAFEPLLRENGVNVDELYPIATANIARANCLTAIIEGDALAMQDVLAQHLPVSDPSSSQIYQLLGTVISLIGVQHYSHHPFPQRPYYSVGLGMGEFFRSTGTASSYIDDPAFCKGISGLIEREKEKIN